MKKLIYSVVCLSLLVLVACQKDDAPEPTTQQKLLGKWQVQKVIDEYYKPVNVLLESDEVQGLPGDSVVFKADGNVYTYSPVYGDDFTDYELLNDTTLRIEDEVYIIRKLTASELYLYNEDIDAVANEKYIQKGYFVR